MCPVGVLWQIWGLLWLQGHPLPNPAPALRDHAPDTMPAMAELPTKEIPLREANSLVSFYFNSNHNFGQHCSAYKSFTSKIKDRVITPFSR